MDKYYTESGSYSAEAVKLAVSSRAIKTDNRTSGDIEEITHSLTLDSNTVINVFFKPSAEYSGLFRASVDGGEAVIYPKGSDGRYCVKIPGISAHQLSEDHTITVTTGTGCTATVTVSALSYVNSALNTYTDNAEAQNAAMAIYAYSRAADAYKSAYPGD